MIWSLTCFINFYSWSVCLTLSRSRIKLASKSLKGYTDSKNSQIRQQNTKHILYNFSIAEVSSWKGCDFYNQFDNGRTFQPRIVFNSSYVFYFHWFTAKRRQNKSLSEKITTFVCQISRHVEKRTWVTFPLVIYDILLHSGFCCWTSNLRFRSKWRTTIWKGEW